MKKIYYNIQLISSFLLMHKNFLSLTLINLFIINSLFSPILCEEETIINTKDNEEIKNIHIGWILFITSIIIISYLNYGGHGPSPETISQTAEILTSNKVSNLSDHIEETGQEITFSNAYILELNNKMLIQEKQIANLQEQLDKAAPILKDNAEYIDALENDLIKYNTKFDVLRRNMLDLSYANYGLKGFVLDHPEMFKEE